MESCNLDKLAVIYFLVENILSHLLLKKGKTGKREKGWKFPHRGVGTQICFLKIKKTTCKYFAKT